MTVICVSPLVIALTIYLLRERLYLPSLQSKVGHMYFGVKNHASNFWELAYSTIFLFRRQFFVMVMFSIPLYPEI